MATEQEVSETLAMLVDYYEYGDEMTPGKARLYVRSLVDLDSAALVEAVTEHVQASKWFPKISELREIAKRRHGAAAIASSVRDEEDAAIRMRAQTLWGLYVYGEITLEQLESDRTWIAYQSLLPHRPGPAPEEQARLDAAWQWAQEETERWMIEEFCPDWRQLPEDTETWLVVRDAGRVALPA